jgi:cold shock CspA family protein
MTNIKGIIQFYESKKGYGYVRVPSTREEFFVHKKHLDIPVCKGDWIRFDVMEDKQGLKAVNIRLIHPIQ